MAAKTFKTEAVVLRGIRYGEADRILHLYSPTHGRLGAIAKGVRKPRSRFGGRLEPFFRLNLVLHRGRGDLSTVSAAATLDGYQHLRQSAAGLSAAARASDAVLRLLDSVEPNPPAYNLLCRYLTLIDETSAAEAAGGLALGQQQPGAAEDAARRARARALAFRFKLALTAGFSPELAGCACCGGSDHLEGFSGAAGGVVCAACEQGAFRLTAETHRFMVEALGNPLAAAPDAADAALGQAERAIGEVLEHHAHVHLRAAA